MQRNRTRLKKDDKVKVLAGKDRGKIGKILKVDRKKERVLVENVNVIKRHTRPNAQNRQGGIVESEAAIHWSNVILLCGKCLQPTRIQVRSLEDDQKVRFCGKCNEMIDA